MPFVSDLSPEVDSSDTWVSLPEVLKKGARNLPLLDGAAVEVVMPAPQSRILAGDTGAPGNLRAQQGGNNIGSARSSAGKVLLAGHDVGPDIDRATGELWWIFQTVDRGVEAFILYVDTTVGDGHGHRVSFIFFFSYCVDCVFNLLSI